MRGAPNLNVSVVVPVYNEESTLETIISRVRADVPNLFEIILVDDCSHDNTPQVIQRISASEPLIRTVRHETNQGKTAALKTAFAMVKGDVVIVQDADLEYDPAE